MTDARPLAGRTALVTGSVAGLGHAMARRLAEAGAGVMLSGLEPEAEIEPIRAKLAAETGSDIGYHAADVADPAQIVGLIDRAADRFGAVDILVNNAVVRHFAPIEAFPLAEWNRALSVNLTAAFVAVQALLPRMRAAGYGRIFNMTSVYGSRGTVNRIDYVTTKTAIIGFTRAIALETAGSPVTCHALTPGAVLTPAAEIRVKALMEAEGIDRSTAEFRFLDGKQPTGRFIRADSVTEMMLLLCGPVGADMNGSIIPIEGGWLARP